MKLNPLQPFTPKFFRQLQQRKIFSRRAFLGSRQGSHLSARRGHGLEFADFRQYSPGDDFRHIDWGIFGRTDRLYVRMFREEQDLNVLCLLDTSRSMALPDGATKFQLASHLALALGYIALTDGDRVTFGFLGDHISEKYLGARSLFRAALEFERVRPVGVFDFSTAVGAALARQRIPGKCFLLSDFLVPEDQVRQAVGILRSKNFDFSFIEILTREEIELDLGESEMLVEDAETGEAVPLALSRASREEYRSILEDHRATVERLVQMAGGTFIRVRADEDLSDIVLSRFPREGVLK